MLSAPRTAATTADLGVAKLGHNEIAGHGAVSPNATSVDDALLWDLWPSTEHVVPACSWSVP